MPLSASVPETNSGFPYRLESEAGAGAMGVVYRATDLTLERTVAIKFLKLDRSGDHAEEERKKRFLQEARAAAALSHPGVAGVYQVGTAEKQPYIVMEWIDGETLESVVEREGPMPIARAAGLIVDLLDVLAMAHERGIVHRDIKPANLMLSARDNLKVTDFGIARFAGQALVETVAGHVLATPRYASPEQLRGAVVDGRSDLFSTAVVFYRLLTGEAPWPGDNAMAVIGNILHQPPQPLSRHLESPPPALEGWFERALANDADGRFATAAHMKKALQRALSPESVSDALTVPTAGMTGALAESAVLFHAPVVTKSSQAALQYVRTWQSVDGGSLDREQLIRQLLDKPLHAPAFAGAVAVDNRLVLVESGVIHGILDLETGRLDPEAELPRSATVHLFQSPEPADSGLVPLLVSAFAPGRPRHQDLDTSVVNLPGLVRQLLAKGFAGVLDVQEEERQARILLGKGRIWLAILAGRWPEAPAGASWEQWLRQLTGIASVCDRHLAPPAVWYRYRYPELPIVATPDEAMLRPADGDLPLGERRIGERGLEPLFRLALEDGASLNEGEGPSSAALGAPMVRFLDWLLNQLPHELVEQRRAQAWKYLADWLANVRRARLHARVEGPENVRSQPFDLVTEDAAGKVLHLAQRLGVCDRQRFKAVTEQAVVAKQALAKRGDIGGLLLVSPHFEPDVAGAYEELIQRGFGNRLLGLDKSTGYEGFVRLSARRGFHLLLVEETDSGFRARFSA